MPSAPLPRKATSECDGQDDDFDGGARDLGGFDGRVERDALKVLQLRERGILELFLGKGDHLRRGDGGGAETPTVAAAVMMRLRLTVFVGSFCTTVAIPALLSLSRMALATAGLWVETPVAPVFRLCYSAKVVPTRRR